MIKKFNGKGSVAIYKREFAECFSDGDYEYAMDALLKFSGATPNPEFHFAFGTLYLLLSQDCDDASLYPLAFREFMIHIRQNPDCRIAYRNLIVAVRLLRNLGTIAWCEDWVKSRGQDLDGIISEIESYGIVRFSVNDDNVIDLEGLLKLSELGTIADCPHSELGNNAETRETESKVLEFGGNPNSTEFGGGDVTEKTDENKEENKIINIDTKKTDDESGEYFPDPDDPLSRELEAKFNELCLLLKAQDALDDDRYDDAIDVLARIGDSDDRNYYDAQCLSALAFKLSKRYPEAQAALNRAFDVFPDRAKARLLQCELFEETNNCENIPAMIEKIDIESFDNNVQAKTALDYAMKYGFVDDALELATAYVDEFNSFDLRKQYARLLFQAGKRDEAESELYILSRILYDDYGAFHSFLMSAKADAVASDLDGLPSKVFNATIEDALKIAFKNDEQLDAMYPDIRDYLNYMFPLFFKFDFENKPTQVKLMVMFEALRKIATNDRFRDFVCDALVSPYAGMLAKSVMLGEMLASKSGKVDFVAVSDMLPVSYDTNMRLAGGYRKGFYVAYAFAVFYTPHLIECFVKYAKVLKKKIKGVECDDCDIAYYLWLKCKRQKLAYITEDEKRIASAFGFTGKTEADARYKAFCKLIGEKP